MSLFAVADAIGLVAFSVSGFLMGVRKGLDLLGVVIAAFLTALGGGIMRDVIVGRTPVAFVKSSVLLYVIAGIVAAFLLRLQRREQVERYMLFILMDSIGLVAFAVTGALLGLSTGFNLFGVLLLAFITAVGGGMLRDIMVNEVPIVLTSDFYGSVALLAAFLIWGLHVLHALNSWTLLCVALIALATRLVAYRRGWRLPRLR